MPQCGSRKYFNTAAKVYNVQQELRKCMFSLDQTSTILNSYLLLRSYSMENGFGIRINFYLPRSPAKIAT